jgi:hypothetical protein
VAGAAPAKIRLAGGHGRPGVGGGRPAGPWGSVFALGCCREKAGEGAHRRPAAVAAASRVGAQQGLLPAGKEAR